MINCLSYSLGLYTLISIVDRFFKMLIGCVIIILIYGGNVPGGVYGLHELGNETGHIHEVTRDGIRKNKHNNVFKSEAQTQTNKRHTNLSKLSIIYEDASLIT